MTTLKTIKSITSTLLLSGVVIFSSCKKDDDNVDPRDAYVGDYELEMECNPTASGEIELEIEKDSQDPKKLILSADSFEDVGLLLDDDLEAEVVGNKFEIESVEGIVIDSDGNIYEVEVSGEGTISGKTLTLDMDIAGDVRTLSCEFVGDKQ